MSSDKYLQVSDHPELIRERQSKAILNKDNQELNKYKQEREEKTKLRKMLVEHEQIKSDIDEIKSMLRQLIGQK